MLTAPHSFSKPPPPPPESTFYPAPYTSSIFDHLCEASTVGGVDTIVRAMPTPVSRLVAVGEQPMIALYRITKVWGGRALGDIVDQPIRQSLGGGGGGGGRRGAMARRVTVIAI